MPNLRPCLVRYLARSGAISAMALIALASAACQDAPKFVFTPPGNSVWAYEAPYSGEFRAQDLEIAALVQLTASDEAAYLIDVSFKGELAVSPYPVPAMMDGDLPSPCGLWLLSPENGQAQEISKGFLGYPWGALFSPDGERLIFSATDECPSATDPPIDGSMWLLDLSTMEKTSLYTGERAPVLRGWAAPDAFLAMREVPDLGWTYRIIGLDPRSERVLDVVLEYQGFNLFTDRPSPRGDRLLLVDQDLTSSFNSELSLASLITGSPTGEPWQGWLHPSAGHSPWSPDNRSLLYLVAGSIRDGMPIDLMTLDVETGEHTPILSGLSAQTDAYLPQAWSPKSEAVLLLPDDRSALHAVNVDGSGLGEVAGSALDGPLSIYHNVRWPAGGGYLFFQRQGPKPERGVMVTSVESEIWAAVVRLPGESDEALNERVRNLQSGPWPVSLTP